MWRCRPLERCLNPGSEARDSSYKVAQIYGAKTCERNSSQIKTIMLCYEVLFQEQALLEEELLWSIPTDVIR
jgi:hypothetical protein